MQFTSRTKFVMTLAPAIFFVMQHRAVNNVILKYNNVVYRTYGLEVASASETCTRLITTCYHW